MIIKTYGATKENPRTGKIAHCIVAEAENGQRSCRWVDGTFFSWKRNGKAMPENSRIERELKNHPLLKW